MTPELHRPLAVDRIAPHGEEVVIEAGPSECEALALRLGLPLIRSLRCRFRLNPAPGGTVAAAGYLRARVMQSCVVTLDLFEETVEEEFSLCFVPHEVETHNLDPEAADEIVYANGVLDLGAAAAEQLALALDPYPRKPGAELPASGDSAETGPFGRLAALRRH